MRDRGMGSIGGFAPEPPPRGTAPWIPAKGEPLEPFTWPDDGAGGRDIASWWDAHPDPA